MNTFDYSSLLPVLPGQSLDWLQQFRAEAMGQYVAVGLPSNRDEDWRYTAIAAIEKKGFIPILSVIDSIDADRLAPYRLSNAWSVVLVDGHFSADLSVLEGLPAEAQVMSMATALQSHAELLAAYLGQAVNSFEHGFIAFNNACFSDGVFINIPAHLVLSQPLQCIHVSTTEASFSATRNVVMLGEHASLQFVETFVGFDASYLSVDVSEVFLAENAQLTSYKVQIESEKAYHFGGTYIKQADNARFSHHNFALGGLLARSDVHTDLQQAAECELNGLSLGNRRQHIDNHTRINHSKPYGMSRQVYKGVFDDRARGVFQGRVVVAENAQKTDSAMNNRNLLLSADAEADSKPQLEIYADDVKCSHGVTVGQLNEQSVFYLQSRGIDAESARNMLTFAFANEMLDKIQLKNLRDLVLAQLLQRFPQQGVDSGWL